MTTLTSPKGSIEFGAGLPTLLINDQLRIMDQSPEVLVELQDGKLDKLLELAHFGQEIGTDMVDLLVNHPGLDEVALLPELAVAICDEIGCPVALDSRNPAALEAAISALKPYKPLINSVSAETESLERLLPVAKEHGAAIVGMPIGHMHGLPKTVKGRLAETHIILEAAEAYGIPREDIVIDAICLASSAEPGSMQVTLDTLHALHHHLGITTILGIGNAGFGMPDQTRIDLAYLLASVPWGLDAALVDPATPGLVEGVRAIDFLTGNDAYGKRYIQHYRNKRQ
jgi:5-methyltetrahydrofolate--homocysteine methyltransferase